MKKLGGLVALGLCTVGALLANCSNSAGTGGKQWERLREQRKQLG